MTKFALLNCCDCCRNLAKNTNIELQKIYVLSTIHLDYSGSLHTFCHCKKYSESTMRIGGILCVWRRGIGKYYLNSEKLGFQYGPRAAGPRSVLNPNFEE